MNFNRLTSDELLDFIRSNEVTLTEESLNRQAERLFNQLVETERTTFTPPVVDLYIATQLKGKLRSPQKYTEEEVLAAPPEAINEFAKVFTTNDRKRIIHILRLMELLEFTIGEMIYAFEHSRIWYLIPTNQKVDSDVTWDQMQRHVVDLGGWQPGDFEIKEKDGEQYMILTPRFENLEINDEFMELPATKENISLAFNENYPEIAKHGALVIERSFDDSVYLEGGDYIDLTLKYHQIDPFDSRLLEHVVIV